MASTGQRIALKIVIIMKGIKIFLDGEKIGSAGMIDDGNIALLLTLQIKDGTLLKVSEVRVMGYASQSKGHREFLTREISGEEVKICFEEITEEEARFRELDFTGGDKS